MLEGANGAPTGVLAFILGGALMPLYSVCLAEVNDRIDGSEMIATASSFVLVYGVGSAVGPFAAGFVIGQAGPSGLFLFMAVTLGLFAAFDALHIGFRPRTARGDKQGYVPTPAPATRCCRFMLIAPIAPMARQRQPEAAIRARSRRLVR
ncbi:MAG: hypothetical protein M5U35_02855 [Roseovarius sp.]|nr:hypothetical protein [Roseovarius sp.]